MNRAVSRKPDRGARVAQEGLAGSQVATRQQFGSESGLPGALHPGKAPRRLAFIHQPQNATAHVVAGEFLAQGGVQVAGVASNLRRGQRQAFVPRPQATGAGTG